jgi:hypothetical protein
MAPARAWGRALVAAWFLAASTADGESAVGSNVRIAVVRSEAGCPSEADFVAAVTGAVTPAALASAPASRFEITLDPEGQGVRGVLVVSGGDGAPPLSRTVFGASCREAAEALALVMVLIIDPLAAQPRFPTPTPSPVPQPSPPSLTVRPREAATGGSAQPPPTLRFAAGASCGVATGVLPGVSLAADARAAASFVRVPIELRASAGVLGPDSIDVAGGSVRFWALEAALAGCSSLRPSRFALGVCAGARADWVFTNAQHYVETTTTTVVVPSVIVAPFLRYSFDAEGRFSAGLEPEVGIVLSPTTWNVIPLGDVHKTSLFTSRVALVLTVAL